MGLYGMNFALNERGRKGVFLAVVVLSLHLLFLAGIPKRVTSIQVTPRQAMQLQLLQLHTQQSISEPMPAIEGDAHAAFKGRPEPTPEPTEEPTFAPHPSPQASTALDNNTHPSNRPEAQLPPNVPRYSAILADPAELHIHIERAGTTGTGKMRWNLDQGNYELQLQADFDEMASSTPSRSKKFAIDWNSQGQAQAWGVAPQRYVSSGKGRSTQATNFQAENGYVSFSGTTLTQPWVAASQDRLSWLMQLGAVLNGSAEQRKVGSRTVLWVLGSRGEADAWEFELQSYTPEQAYLVRKPQRLYDAQVQVWLNPQRQHLPLRLQLGYRGVRDTTQMFFQ